MRRRVAAWVLSAVAGGALMALLLAPGAHAVASSSEISVLTSIYTAMNGAAWMNPWPSPLSSDPCTAAWYGVTCDATGV